MSDILHQADQQQFVCTVDGKLSRLAYRRLDATTVDAYSTQVPPELRGQGIADKLARRCASRSGPASTCIAAQPDVDVAVIPHLILLFSVLDGDRPF